MARYPAELWILLLLTLASGVVFVVAYRRRWAPRVWLAVTIGLVLRVAVVGLSYGHTPHDVAAYFSKAGELVLDGHDPMTGLPRFQWNFLPLMPYVFAAEISTGLPWEIAGKIAPVLADVVCIVLLARLATPANARVVPLLYAVCPVAVLVTAAHGQVEPVALALGLGALLLARRRLAPATGPAGHGLAAGAGLLAGLAIAAKTWPVVLTVGLLRETSPRRWWRVAAAAALAPLAMLASVPLLLHDSIGDALRVLMSYRSFVGAWGWTGVLRGFGVLDQGYTGPGIDAAQSVGTLLLLVAVVTVIVLFRKLDGVALTAAVLIAFLVVTAGFGYQYLLWPVPFVLLLGHRRGIIFVAAASVAAIYAYLFVIPEFPAPTPVRGDAFVGLSLIVIATGLGALPWTMRRAEIASADAPGLPSDPAPGIAPDEALAVTER